MTKISRLDDIAYDIKLPLPADPEPSVVTTVNNVLMSDVEDDDYEYNRDVGKIGYDLYAALNNNNLAQYISMIDRVSEVIGSHDGPNWHWLVRIGAEFAYITGGCDYTGWDCQSHCEVIEAHTLHEAEAAGGPNISEIFKEMIFKNERTRTAHTDW